ncbi:MAG: winged helix-turn-helix domain-containing protein [Campylobacterota bacterium]|nr:winged helix-turn-helix domain-containing protein [Campylobacterota bacterium]
MAKKITINRQHTREELEREIKKTRDGRYRLRLQAINLVMEGLTSQMIVKRLMITRESLFRWVRWYNEKSLEGIREVSSGGRPEGNPKWEGSIFEALYAKLDLMEEFFSVPKMQAWIESEYGIVIPERTIHSRLKANGYSFKSSRPNPYKGDPELQAAFKKAES